MEEEDGFELDPDEKYRFLCARKGDSLCTTFQCEICHFRNIKKRDMDLNSALDLKLKTYMRRANLDAFWSRQESTVRSSAQ